MNAPSRRERRQLAKNFGLTGNKESYQKWTERIKRSQDFGKMLHMQHLQDLENQKTPDFIEASELTKEKLEQIIDRED